MKWALLGFTAVVLTAADSGPVSNTQRLDFPAGATLRMKNSIGELTVEGWDRPDLEITTIKMTKAESDSAPNKDAAKQLDRVRVTTERKGDEVVITTDFPKEPVLLRPFRGRIHFDLEYRIKAPRNARLTIDHDSGEVHIVDITGDLHITDHSGQITAYLPSEGQYEIDARSKLGAIDSDFAGREQRKLKFGHAFVNDASAAKQKLYLRIGFGDITILAMRKPPTPPALPQK